eukprot:8027933-Pyramimonas_sp.AAC.1
MVDVKGHRADAHPCRRSSTRSAPPDRGRRGGTSSLRRWPLGCARCIKSRCRGRSWPGRRSAPVQHLARVSGRAPAVAEITYHVTDSRVEGSVRKDC